MSHLLTAAKLTADMVQRRDDMRRLLGDRYAGEVEVARKVIRGLAKESGKSIADAALAIAKNMSRAGHDPSIAIAGFVEECGV